MSTTNTDFLPNVTGLNLGSPDQRWDGYFDSLTAENVSIIGVPTTTGDATSLQGVPIDPIAPLNTQFLVFNGIEWIPGFQSFDAISLLSRPLSVNVPALNQVLAWDGIEWIPTTPTGGGGGATFGYVATPFSVTPTFTPNPIGSCSFAITLGSNVTSSTFDTTGLTAGSIFNFQIVQDGTGGHTFAWPVEALGTQLVATAAGQSTVQNFFWDGTNLIATGFPAVF